MSTVPSSIELDFYRWLLDQSAALQGRRYKSLDWDSLAEELQAMARSLEHGLQSDLEILLTHLLKWHYQPKRRGPSWQASIQNARSSIADRLEDSPSLATKLEKLTTRAYGKARRSAGAEMRLSERQWEAKFPQACPWDFSTFTRPDFWPAKGTGQEAGSRPAPKRQL